MVRALKAGVNVNRTMNFINKEINLNVILLLFYFVCEELFRFILYLFGADRKVFGRFMFNQKFI